MGQPGARLLKTRSSGDRTVLVLGGGVGGVVTESLRDAFADFGAGRLAVLTAAPAYKCPAAGMTGADGWVPVDRHTLETSFPGVFAIGDVTTVPLLLGKPLPKAGVFAHGQAQVVAQNIWHAIEGRGRSARFDGHGSCFIETGDGKAVREALAEALVLR